MNTINKNTLKFVATFKVEQALRETKNSVLIATSGIQFWAPLSLCWANKIKTNEFTFGIYKPEMTFLAKQGDKDFKEIEGFKLISYLVEKKAGVLITPKENKPEPETKKVVANQTLNTEDCLVEW